MARISKAESLAGLSDVVKSRRITNNTFKYETAEGDTVIRLHRTDIIVHKADGKTVLNSGGWRTVTTKARLNDYSGYSVYSKNGTWFVNDKVPFEDFMVLPDALEQDTKAIAAKLAKVNRLKARLKKFVAKLDKLDTLPRPSNGDCWGCLFVADDGSRPMGSDCAKMHVEEGYLHGSLLVRAMQWCGYDDRRIGLHFVMNDRSQLKRCLYRFLKHEYSLA